MLNTERFKVFQHIIPFLVEDLNKRLAGRFIWLLGEMCRQQGIDEAYVDSGLTYWENKRILERRFMTVLVLRIDKLEEAKERKFMEEIRALVRKV